MPKGRGKNLQKKKRHEKKGEEGALGEKRPQSKTPERKKRKVGKRKEGRSGHRFGRLSPGEKVAHRKNKAKPLKKRGIERGKTSCLEGKGTKCHRLDRGGLRKGGDTPLQEQAKNSILEKKCNPKYHRSVEEEDKNEVESNEKHQVKRQNVY